MAEFIQSSNKKEKSLFWSPFRDGNFGINHDSSSHPFKSNALSENSENNSLWALHRDLDKLEEENKYSDDHEEASKGDKSRMSSFSYSQTSESKKTKKRDSKQNSKNQEEKEKDEIVGKVKDKKEKDKERARESRQKKKDYVKKLEDRIKELEDENKRIKSYFGSYVLVNYNIRKLVFLFLSQHNFNFY